MKALRDRWIPNHPTNSIIHSANNGMEDLVVLDLIDQYLHWWRSGYIMTLFQREDVEAICRIPLSRRYVADSIVWIHNKKGRFIVKSAYKVAREILRGPNWAECSSGCAGKRDGLPYGSFISQIRSRCLNGEHVIIFCQHE